MTSSGSKERRINHRGCVVLAVISLLVLLLLIAISMGWLGKIDRGKTSGIPVVTGNQS
jgi:hypothetical protein